MEEFIALIIGMLIIILGITLMIRAFEKDDVWLYIISIIIFISSIFIAGFIYKAITNENTPQAIDVYSGKITLQITYQDSIQVDTVVVFKK